MLNMKHSNTPTLPHFSKILQISTQADDEIEPATAGVIIFQAVLAMAKKTTAVFTQQSQMSHCSQW